jgi:hypothetical protein
MSDMDFDPNLQLGVTAEQFAEILRLAYLGEWLINSQHDSEHQDDGATEALQVLLALAAKLSPDAVGQDEETGRYFVREELARAWQERHVLDYDDHVFWQELAERLAERDLATELGLATDGLDLEEYAAQLRELRDRYWRELDQHGIERVDFRSFE